MDEQDAFLDSVLVGVLIEKIESELKKKADLSALSDYATEDYIKTFVSTTLTNYMTSDDVMKNVESAITNANTYSTEEVQIGKWIDGRPLYKKTVSGITPDETKVGSYVVIITDPVFSIIDSVPKIYGFVEYTKKNLPPINIYLTSTNYIGTWFINNSIQVCIGGPGWANKPIYITLEYTKSTDRTELPINKYSENIFQGEESVAMEIK